MVLAASEHTPYGPIEPKRVEEIFEDFAPVVNLHIDGQVIRTTAEHRFYIHGNGWTPVKEMQPGDEIRSEDGQRITVEAITDTGEETPVYNMRVADYHTYFVGCAAWGFSVWAHNAYQVNDQRYRDGYDAIFGSRRRTADVSALEVGQYGNLASRSVRDGMTPDHIPSYAAIRARVERQLGRRLTDAEAAQLRNETNAMVVQTRSHQDASRTYGGRNTRQQIQNDSQDLETASTLDRQAWRQRLIDDGNTPEEVDSAFQMLDQLNREAGRY